MVDKGTKRDISQQEDSYYPKPSTIPAGTRCLTFQVPDSAEWYGLAVGAMWELMRSQNYEKSGLDIDLVIDRWLEMFRTMEVTCSMTVPIGGTMMWWSDTLPDKWKILNGQPLSKTTYPELFAIFGYTHGGGFETFLLPTMRGFSPYGAGADVPLNQAAGANDRALNVGNLPAHNHPVIDPGHRHTQRIGTGAGTNALAVGTTNNANATVTRDNLDNSTTGITTGNTGSGNAFSILHPVRACHYIIYAGR